MTTTVRWKQPVALSAEEQRIAKVLKRVGKFYVFLREVRDELFDEEFQAELAAAYDPRGREPLPAALLAMVTLLQAYDKTGDADAVVTAQMDKRWQLVLGNMHAGKAPFSQGVLSQFRERMIQHDLAAREIGVTGPDINPGAFVRTNHRVVRHDHTLARLAGQL